MYTYKNDFLVYLPIVNQKVSTYNIFNSQYKIFIESLLNFNNIEDIDK